MNYFCHNSKCLASLLRYNPVLISFEKSRKTTYTYLSFIFLKAAVNGNLLVPENVQNMLFCFSLDYCIHIKCHNTAILMGSEKSREPDSG